MTDKLTQLAREVEQAEATVEGVAKIVVIFFDALRAGGMTREEALSLTEVFLVRTFRQQGGNDGK